MSGTFYIEIYFYHCTGLLDPVVELTAQYNVMDSSVTISWSPPPALVISPAIIPERFYCVEVFDQTMSVIDSRGCDRNVNRSEETSFILTNVVCGTNYDILVTPFNQIGDGVKSTVLFPGGYSYV